MAGVSCVVRCSFWVVRCQWPWPYAGSKTGNVGGSPRPSKSVVRLAAQSVSGDGKSLGVYLAGLSGETWFLAYLLL